MKVRALPIFEGVIDSEVGRTRKVGEEFEVSEERAKVLLGDNKNKIVFVEAIEEINTINVLNDDEEKPKKKTKKKIEE